MSVSSGRCSFCHGCGLSILGPGTTDGPGGRNLEGWILRCDSCDGSGLCKHCHGTGEKRAVKFVGGIVTDIWVEGEATGSCEQCDQKKPSELSGQEEVVFRGYHDGGEFGTDEHFVVKRVRAGDRFGLEIESGYNARGLSRVVLPIRYRTLTVTGRTIDEFEVEADGQMVVVRHVRVAEVRDAQPKRAPAPVEKPPPSPTQVNRDRRQATATNSSLPTPPQPKEVKCRCCGQPRPDAKPECPNCGFTEWYVFVVLFAFAGVWAAIAYWFGAGWCIWIAGGLGGLGLLGVGRNVWAHRRNARGG
jgi:hypothetical protein